MLLSDFFHFNISLSVTLLQTPAEQAKVRMHLVLQAAGKWIILMWLRNVAPSCRDFVEVCKNTLQCCTSVV